MSENGMSAAAAAVAALNIIIAIARSAAHQNIKRKILMIARSCYFFFVFNQFLTEFFCFVFCRLTIFFDLQLVLLLSIAIHD